MMLNPVLLSKQITLLHDHFFSDIVTYGILCSSSGYPSAHLNDLFLFIICCFCIYLNEEIHNLLVYWIKVITKLPNSEQSYKGKVKTHKCINRRNQSTTGNCENRNDPDLVQAFLRKWWVESDFKAPNLPHSLRLKGSGCHYNSIYNNTGTK